MGDHYGGLPIFYTYNSSINIHTTKGVYEMQQISYWFKQLFPLDYYTKYRTNGNLYVATWKQQFGKPKDVHHYRVCA